MHLGLPLLLTVTLQGLLQRLSAMAYELPPLPYAYDSLEASTDLGMPPCACWRRGGAAKAALGRMPPCAGPSTQPQQQLSLLEPVNQQRQCLRMWTAPCFGLHLPPARVPWACPPHGGLLCILVQHPTPLWPRTCLQPYVDTLTMQLHHDAHHKTCEGPI